MWSRGRQSGLVAGQSLQTPTGRKVPGTRGPETYGRISKKEKGRTRNAIGDKSRRKVSS